MMQPFWNHTLPVVLAWNMFSDIKESNNETFLLDTTEAFITMYTGWEENELGPAYLALMQLDKGKDIMLDYFVELHLSVLRLTKMYFANTKEHKEEWLRETDVSEERLHAIRIAMYRYALLCVLSRKGLVADGLSMDVKEKFIYSFKADEVDDVALVIQFFERQFRDMAIEQYDTCWVANYYWIGFAYDMPTMGKFSLSS